MWMLAGHPLRYASSPATRGRPVPAWRARGFTLVELLLAISLLLLLFGAIAFNFGSLQRGAQLDEGASQVEALVQFARAQAASTGRRLMVIYSEREPSGTASGGDPVPLLELVWERDPLGGPGVFERLPEADAYLQGITDLVKFESIHSLDLSPGRSAGAGGTNSAARPQTQPAATTQEPGTSAPPLASESEGVAPNPFAPLVFYPDGSTDPMEMILLSRDSEDSRRLQLRLTGMSGSIQRRLLPRDPFQSKDPALPQTEESPAAAATAEPVEAPQ